ncbi:MAG: hypothetical protein M3O98_05350 [Actinomycetota bacterium]|nr:hypothetical protein [Actinomycetota bacterium]
MDEAGSPSSVVEARRRVEALDRLTGQLAGQIVVLDLWEADPSTLREALATIVQAMQQRFREIAPALLLLLAAQIDAERWDPIKALGLASQLF